METFILWLCTAFAGVVLAFLAWEDWFHVSRPARRVMARVVGHRSHHSDSTKVYAAQFEFTGEDGKPVHVTDKVYMPRPKQSVGDRVELTHPKDMPHRARINRPWLRAGIYAAMLYLLVVLIGRLTGWLSAGGGGAVGY
jgi:hypothetical protein